MSALLPYVDQAAVNTGVPAPLLSQIAWDLELDTPSAVNAKAQQLAANIKGQGGDIQKGVFFFYKENGLGGAAATRKTASVLEAAALPAAGESEESAIERLFNWGKVDPEKSNAKSGFTTFGVEGLFKNGSIVIIGIAVLILAVLANDNARAVIVGAVAKGKA